MSVIQKLGHTNMLNGWTTMAGAAGTEVPLLGNTYTTGTITMSAGSNRIVGSGTTFSATNSPPGQTLLTAGGNLYTIRRHTVTTELEVEETPTATEAGVTYQIYRRPESAIVLIKARAANAGNMFVGLRGNISSTTGYVLAAGDELILELNLKLADVWIDKANVAATEAVHWIVLY